LYDGEGFVGGTRMTKEELINEIQKEINVLPRYSFNWDPDSPSIAQESDGDYIIFDDIKEVLEKVLENEKYN